MSGFGFMGTENDLDNTRTGISARTPQLTKAQLRYLLPTSPVSCDSSKIRQRERSKPSAGVGKVPCFAPLCNRVERPTNPYPHPELGITSGGRLFAAPSVDQRYSHVDSGTRASRGKAKGGGEKRRNRKWREERFSQSNG